MPLQQSIIDRTFHSSLGEAGYHVIEILIDAGYEAWWVGGSVRDMLQGNIPHDIDIATNAKPTEIAPLFPKHDDTRADLGAMLVSHEGHEFEVTTFREESEVSDGRDPSSVVYTTREQDAKRRDITVNALYWQPISSELYDPFGGEGDLEKKIIKMIGDPVVRLEHDALRLLRTVRFRAELDAQYDPLTYQALHTCADQILILSGERCLREIEKMLLGPHPERAFEDLWETDIIEHLIPELHKCRGVAQPADYHKEGDVWEHTLQCISSFTEDHLADIRWAALLHDVGKPETYAVEERIRFDGHAEASAEIATAVLERLNMPKKHIEKIHWLARHHMMMGAFEPMNDERKSHWYYHPWFTELLQLFWLDIAGTTPSNFSFYEEIVRDYNQFLDAHPLPPKPLLKGDRVMEILGIQPGERVGEVMKLLYDAQVRKEITTKKEAEDFLRNI